MEPEKPFACTLSGCGMTFTNEDHLHVHTKKHDMVLQLGMEQKAAFVADQTPTPTRFIRNCEEVGLFQDLQNVTVNPFDEGFKRAMETKHGALSMEGAASNEDVLHTPHLVFPLEPGDCALYTANNQRNITISRSSSDESGAVKEYETTTISKLTNEVTTISRVVGKQDVLDRVTTTDDVSIVKHEETARNKDGVNEKSVSYTNNVIKIHSNVEIRKDGNIVNIDAKTPTTLIYTDSVIKDTTTKDVSVIDTKKVDKFPPIMSQKSIDFVVDSLTSDVCGRENVKELPKHTKRTPETADKTRTSEKAKDKTIKTEDSDDYEVIIKLPNGKRVKMKAVEETEPINTNAKEELKKVIIKNKVKCPIQKESIQMVHSLPQMTPNILPAGTLIPVTFVSPRVVTSNVPKIPIAPLHPIVKSDFKSPKRKSLIDRNKDSNSGTDDTQKCDANGNEEDSAKWNLQRRSAASKRYRDRLKQYMNTQTEENKHLREANQRLKAEKAVLQHVITQHLKKCPIGDDLRNIQEKLKDAFLCINDNSVKLNLHD